MEKRQLVRLQLWILGAVTMLLLYRVISAPLPSERSGGADTSSEKVEATATSSPDRQDRPQAVENEVEDNVQENDKKTRNHVELNLSSIHENDVILSLTELGNNVDKTGRFEIQQPTSVRIVSIGEITESGKRYDYGVITNLSTDSIVWEMQLDNTRPAGGHDSNRLYDGRLVLQPGTYEVRFVTDETHAYGNFDTYPPATPEAWGITIIQDEDDG